MLVIFIVHLKNDPFIYQAILSAVALNVSFRGARRLHQKVIGHIRKAQENIVIEYVSRRKVNKVSLGSRHRVHPLS
jgi:hypothetical protein